MNTETFTHNGWFGFCPVKVGDLGQEPILMAPRWFWLAPIFFVSQEFAKASITFASAFSDEQPAWRLRITGERKS
jgi:hypothetical protein